MNERSESSAEPMIDRSRPPAPGAIRPFHFSEVHRGRISNGVPVVVAPTHHFPIVTVGAVVFAGGTREREDEAGLASLTAELLDSGAGGRTATELAETFESLGAQTDTGSSWDAAHVDMTVLSSRLGDAMPAFTDLVRRPAFPREEFSRKRDERLARILQRRKDPGGFANEMAARYIFSPSSPYSRPLSGTPETVSSLTRAAVEAFHEANYGPGDLVLVISGDLSVHQALDLAESSFGDWTGDGAVASPIRVEPRSTESHIIVVDRPGSVQSELRLGHVGPSRSTRDYFSIVVMNAILGGAFSSRLNLSLRERHGFTYGVHSGFSMRRDGGGFVVGTAVQSEVTAAAVGEVLREFRSIREEPVSGAELEDARSYIAGTFPLPLQTTEGVVNRLLEQVVHHLPDDYFDRYRERILNVSADDVLAAARKYVDPERLAIVVVGDAEQIVAPLEALGLAPVEVVSPEDEKHPDPTGT